MSVKIFEKQKEIRGLKTSWLEAGLENNGETLFLLHGFPDTAWTWTELIEHFSKNGYRVIAPFLRGTPQSPYDQASRCNLDSVSLDLIEILNETKTKNPVIVGHDIGVMHAWNLARLLKDDAKGLCVFNGASIDQMLRRFQFRPDQVIKSWYIGVFQIPGLAEWVWENLGKENIYKIHKRGTPLQYFPQDPKVTEPFIAHYRQAFKLLPKLLLSSPQKIRLKTLVLAGKDDPYLVVPTQREINRLSSNATLRVLDCGHWLHHERKDQFCELLDQFVKKG